MEVKTGLKSYINRQNELASGDSVTSTDSVNIHPSAIVAKGAELGVGVNVGPFTFVGPNVVLKDNVSIGSFCTIDNRTTIGENTSISGYATVGVPPQDLKYDGEPTKLVIGRDNCIREYTNFSIGTAGGGGITTIGDNNLFMVYTHVAHDCIVGNQCIFANGVSLAGHVEIADLAILGGHIAVHQFCHVGTRVMVAGGAMVVQDVPPYTMVQGDRAKVYGLNVVGLRRAGIPAADIKSIKTMYRLLYRENLTVEDAVAKIQSDIEDSEYRKTFVDFLHKSTRGVCR